MIAITEEKRQALIESCNHIISEQPNSPYGVIAKIALASLEAPVMGYIHKSPWAQWKQATCTGDEFGLEAYKDTDNHFAVYTAPPVPAMHPIELPLVQVDNPFDGLFYKCDEVIAAIRAAGYEVKE